MSGERIDIDVAPERLRGWVELLGDRLGVVLRNLVGKRVFLVTVRRTPVGHPSTDPATGKKKRGTKHPGKLRASWSISEGKPKFLALPDLPSYPIRGAPEADADLASARTPGQPLFLANAAADEGRESSYAASIDAGRRYNEKLGRMLGSEAAPEGMLQPAIDEVAESRATIEAEATKVIEAML